jgi:hypothetical protein
MGNFSISKSAFIKGLQCHKQIYLHYHFPQYKDPITKQESSRFKRGLDVGILAHQLFPKGKIASLGRNYEKWFSNTQKLISSATDVIFEAAFSNGNAMTIIDILDKNGKQWNAWEVKSVLNVSETHINDLAFQCYVMQLCGIKIAKAGIVHLNRNYKRAGELNMAELFTFTELTKQIEEKYSEIEQAHQDMLLTLSKKEIPEISLNTHCFEPYACSFMRYCWDNSRKNEIIHELQLEQNYLDELEQKRIISVHQKPSSPKKSKIEYPILIVARSAVPFIDNLSPFQKIPFAVIDNEGKVEMYLNVSRQDCQEVKPDKTFVSIHKFDEFQTVFPEKNLAKSLSIIESELNAMLNNLAMEQNIILRETLIADIENRLYQNGKEFKSNNF